MIIYYFDDGYCCYFVEIYASIFPTRNRIVIWYKNQPMRVYQIDRVLSHTLSSEHVPTFGWGRGHQRQCPSIIEDSHPHLDGSSHSITVLPREISPAVECPLKSSSPKANLHTAHLVIVT